MQPIPQNPYGFQDIRTPIGAEFSARFIRSNAYTIIKDNLPVILTRVIDHFNRKKESIPRIYGEDAKDEIKYLIGFISKLKNEIITNKTLKPLRYHDYVSNKEAEEWNRYLEHRIEIEGEIPRWFNTNWLYCECYMYRMLAQEISLTVRMTRYDPFEDDKQLNFIRSIKNVNLIAMYMKNLFRNQNITITTTKRRANPLLREDFQILLHMCLWSNSDLSSLTPRPVNLYVPVEELDTLDENILVNNGDYIWDIISADSPALYIIDIILDNAGYELFTDICLAAFLFFFTNTNQIRFHVKKYPWYVSDVTSHDFYWMIEHMSHLDDYPELQFLSKIYFQLLDSRIWVIEEEPFWTSPYSFRDMREKSPSLYRKLSDAKLVIFKGDLNYRKLLGDINFEYNTNFTTALGSFCPTNILSLRTLRSEICVGLTSDVIESLSERDKKWMKNGWYGLIQANINFQNIMPD